MALHRCFAPGVIVSAGGAATVTLESSPSTTTFGLATNFDTTVTIPAGSNRLLLDMVGLVLGVTINSWDLDPTSVDEALTQLTGSPISVGTDETIAAAFLLETGIAAVGEGSKTLRMNISAARRPGRQAWIFSGAAQAEPPSQTGTVTAGGALTITLTGTYDAGTYLAAACFASATGAYTVTGTGGLVEILDVDNATDVKHFVSAGKLLESTVVNPTVIFTRDGGGNTDKAGFLAAVEPA